MSDCGDIFWVGSGWRVQIFVGCGAFGWVRARRLQYLGLWLSGWLPVNRVAKRSFQDDILVVIFCVFDALILPLAVILKGPFATRLENRLSIALSAENVTTFFVTGKLADSHIL